MNTPIKLNFSAGSADDQEICSATLFDVHFDKVRPKVVQHWHWTHFFYRRRTAFFVIRFCCSSQKVTSSESFRVEVGGKEEEKEEDRYGKKAETVGRSLDQNDQQNILSSGNGSGGGWSIKTMHCSKNRVPGKSECDDNGGVKWWSFFVGQSEWRLREGRPQNLLFDCCIWIVALSLSTGSNESWRKDRGKINRRRKRSSAGWALDGQKSRQQGQKVRNYTRLHLRLVSYIFFERLKNL